MAEPVLPVGLLGSLLFTMIGPIGLLPNFASVTANSDRSMQMRIALIASVISLLSLSLAVLIGGAVMQSAGTSASSLIIAAGIILLLTALRNIFGSTKTVDQQFPEPTLRVALKPIAIPGIVTPMGVAVLILFSSYFSAFSDRIVVLMILVVITVLNFCAMISAHWFMRVVGPAPLIILGAIFGVLQAAMGIEMVMSGFMRSSLLEAILS